MIEFAQNLILNQEILKDLSEKKQIVFIYEWLCFLNKVLLAAQKNDLRDNQTQIILEQLLQQIENESNPPIRMLLGQNLAILLDLNESQSCIHQTINYCNEILRSNHQTSQLTTIVILGELYQRLNRFLHQSYEETIELLLKLLKNGDSQMRCEILLTFERVITGLSSIARNSHREIFKNVKIYLIDRVLSVRSSAAVCLISLINQNNFMYTNELEGNLILGFRAFEGTNGEIRCSIARYLARLIAATQEIEIGDSMKKISVENALNYLSEGFLRGRSNVNEQSKESIIIQHEIRLGMTHTYIHLIRLLGSQWLEQNLSLFLTHLLQLAGNPRLSTSHIDAIFSRQCILFILKSIINSNRNEKILLLSANELITIISRYITSPSMNNSSLINTNDSNISSLNSSTHSLIHSYISTTVNQLETSNQESHQNLLLCAFEQLNILIEIFGSSTSVLLKETHDGLINTLFSLLVNSSYPVRLTIAWCFRSIALVLPSLLTSLIEKSLEKIHDLPKEINSYYTDTISAYALVLQSLLGLVHQSSSGLSSTRLKSIFDFAEHLLRTAISFSSGQDQCLILRLLLQQTHTAWHILSACCTLNQIISKTYFRRLISLWKNVFPRSQNDFEREKQRGDLFTWILSLNQRSGALCSMISFLNTYSSEQIFKYLNPILQHIFSIFFYLPNLIRTFGQQLKISTIIFRLRFYELLLLIPIEFSEDYWHILIKKLIDEFTFIDSPIDLITSLLKSLCHQDDHILFGISSGFSSEENDIQFPSYSFLNFGTFEHDETYLYRRNSSSKQIIDLNIPKPLPLSILLIDKSIELFSRIFVRISNKSRLKIFEQYLDLIKQSKESIQINLLTSILLSFKTLIVSQQSIIIDDELKKCTYILIIQLFNHHNPLIRYAAGQTFGYFIRIVNDEQFLSDLRHFCLSHFKESRDLATKTGYLFAIACLYRHSKQDFNIFPILLEEQSNQTLQLVILHSLKIIVDSYREIDSDSLESLFDYLLHLLLSKYSQIEIYHYSSRLLSSLIRIIGQDLQINTDYISSLRSSCLTAIHLLEMYHEYIIQADAIDVYREFSIYASRYVNLSCLIPNLIQGLQTDELVLKRSCISCLKQFSQREAKEIYKYSKIYFNNNSNKTCEEFLFDLLNKEIDRKIYLDIQDTLIYLIKSFGFNQIEYWIKLLRDLFDIPILLEKPNSSIDNEENENDEELVISIEENSITQSKIFRKWSTKIFALQCLEHLLTLSPKEQLSLSFNEDFNTLFSITYSACTSIDDQLRQIGLLFLTKLIDKCSYFDCILFQNRIHASIRSCFSPNTSSHLTTTACHVCIGWIRKFISTNRNDLRRLDQLLLSSLQKLISIHQQLKNEKNILVNENLLISENLSILTLWSDVYNFLIKEKHAQFLTLIQTELYILIHHWLACLNDFHQINRNLTSILRATIHWLIEHQYEFDIQSSNRQQKDLFLTKLSTLTLTNSIRTYPEEKEEIFVMLFSRSMYILSRQIETIDDDLLMSIDDLLQTDFAKGQITKEIAIELIEILQRQFYLQNELKLIKISKHILDLFSPIDQSILHALFQFLISILFKFYPNLIQNTSLSTIYENEIPTNLDILSYTIQFLYDLIKFSPNLETTNELIRIDLHTFLSISLHILSTKSDQDKSLLILIFGLIENLSTLEINQTIFSSTVNTIVNFRMKLIEQNLSDNGYFIRCLTVLILNSNTCVSRQLILQFYRTAFSDQDFETHYHLLQCLNQLIQMKNQSLRNEFIHNFVPLFIIDFKQSTNSQYSIEIFKIFETLLSIVDPKYRIRLASLIIPLLINFLSDSNSIQLKLFEHLQHLQTIYSNEFRMIFDQYPIYKFKFDNFLQQQDKS